MSAQYRDESRHDPQRLAEPTEGRSPWHARQPFVLEEDEWQKKADRGENRPKQRGKDADGAQSSEPFPVGVIQKADTAETNVKRRQEKMSEIYAERTQNSEQEYECRHLWVDPLSCQHQEMFLFWQERRQSVDDPDGKPQGRRSNGSHDYPGQEILDIKPQVSRIDDGRDHVADNLGAETEDEQPLQDRQRCAEHLKLELDRVAAGDKHERHQACPQRQRRDDPPTHLSSRQAVTGSVAWDVTHPLQGRDGQADAADPQQRQGQIKTEQRGSTLSESGKPGQERQIEIGRKHREHERRNEHRPVQEHVAHPKQYSGPCIRRSNAGLGGQEIRVRAQVRHLTNFFAPSEHLLDIGGVLVRIFRNPAR